MKEPCLYWTLLQKRPDISGSLELNTIQGQYQHQWCLFGSGQNARLFCKRHSAHQIMRKALCLHPTTWGVSSSVFLHHKSVRFCSKYNLSLSLSAKDNHPYPASCCKRSRTKIGYFFERGPHWGSLFSDVTQQLGMANEYLLWVVSSWNISWDVVRLSQRIHLPTVYMYMVLYPYIFAHFLSFRPPILSLALALHIRL